MNNKIGYIFTLAIGAAVGSVVTWRLVKKKYEQQAQEEIDEMREYFKKKQTALNNEVQKAHEYSKINKDKNESTQYSSTIDSLGYSSKSEKKEEPEEPVEEHINNSVYVIAPESFGECDYQTESLTYYADDVLTYDTGEIIKNRDELIGPGSLKCFGEYEDDSVFVRNDELKIDFEILADMRTYFDANSVNHHSEDDR